MRGRRTPFGIPHHHLIELMLVLPTMKLLVPPNHPEMAPAPPNPLKMVPKPQVPQPRAQPLTMTNLKTRVTTRMKRSTCKPRLKAFPPLRRRRFLLLRRSSTPIPQSSLRLHRSSMIRPLVQVRQMKRRINLLPALASWLMVVVLASRFVWDMSVLQ